MKRYTWKCGCGEFDLPTHKQPIECIVCGQPVKRIFKVNVAYHPTKGNKR